MFTEASPACELRAGASWQAAMLLVVTVVMIWWKARKMQLHPKLMDPELAAIMRNGGKGALSPFACDFKGRATQGCLFRC